MGIYEDWQIHSKTGFRPIELQESRSGPHTNRTPSDNYYLLTGCKGRTWKYKPRVLHTARACVGCLENQGLVLPGTARALQLVNSSLYNLF